MPRYAAFLRGVMPTNAKMPQLRKAFEAAGFTDVKIVLGTGNVVFTSRKAAESTIERKAEAAMRKHLGREFFTIVRPVDALRRMLEADPFSGHRLKPGSRRVVTFMRKAPRPAPKLPVELEGARILSRAGREAFTTYVRGSGGPAFMRLIETTFGKDVTTRTWETVEKVAR